MCKKIAKLVGMGKVIHGRQMWQLCDIVFDLRGGSSFSCMIISIVRGGEG